jgi:lipopolysaccharide export system protein LptA
MCVISRKKLFLRLLLVYFLALTSPVALAQENDSDQPILIESNSAIYDDNKGISTYLGNVKAKQGSLHLTSDELIVYLNDGKVDRLEATGTPVRFKRVASEGKEEMRGKSLRAKYFPDKALLIMIEEAVVWQGDNTYASEIIKYDNKNAIVRAGEQSSDSKRVKVTIKPNKKKTETNGETGSKTFSEEIQQ